MTSKIDNAQSSIREIKDVLILMPFQSESSIGKKTSYLEKRRIQYIVENLINIKSRSYPDSFIKYKANIVNTGVGDIEEIVEEKFEKTDLFIALLSKSNVNVIFEVAILNVLQQNLVLLRDSDIESHNIPIYFKKYAFIEFYSGEEGEEMKRFIKRLASDPNFKVYGDDKYSKGKVDEYIEKIKNIDSYLVEKLQEDIYRYERGDVKPPLAFRKLVRDVHPSNALSTWDTLIPMCILKAKWMPTIKDTTQYEGEDSLIEPIYAVSCNTHFTRMLGTAIGDPEKFIEANYPLTGTAQMKMFQPYMSKENFDALEKDQIDVFEKLFIQDKPTKAVVPIGFSNSKHEHPFSEFRDTVYLPVLLSKKVVGIRSSPHATYYVIAYVEDFFPFDGNKSKKKT